MIVPQYFASLQMINARVGYAVGGRQTQTIMHLYKTVDGGRRWTEIAPRLHPAAPPTVAGSSVLFPMRLHSRFVVERSSDGGRTWRASAPFTDAGRPAGPGQVVALDASHLYLPLGEGAAAGSEAQALFRSADGGRTWRFVSRTQAPSGPVGRALPFSCDKTGFGFATLRVGWAGGDCAGGRVFFYRTEDGGRTWRWQLLPVFRSCVCEVSPPRFFGPHVGALAVVGASTTSRNGSPVARVFWTSDGGRHWRMTQPPVARVTGSVSFPSSRSAWIFGGRAEKAPWRYLFRTTDAGRHWQVVRLPLDTGTHTFDVVNATVAFALAADQRTLLRTTDGGRSWRKVG